LLGGRLWKKQQLQAVIGSFSRGQTDQNVTHVLGGSYVVLFHVIGCRQGVTCNVLVGSRTLVHGTYTNGLVYLLLTRLMKVGNVFL
jgi:hypothetical protein